jgi:hypothetical protein
MAELTSGRIDTFSPSAFPALEASKKTKPSGQHVHVDVSCDVCGRNPIGVRYKCLYCPNYDLCANCLKNVENFQPKTGSDGFKNKPLHNPDHRFIRMAAVIPVTELPTHLQNREHMIHQGISCSTCDKREIVGFRYFCPECGVSLCEACELLGK